MSLDGFIATKDGDIGFLSIVGTENEGYGYHDFIEKIGTVILGRKTYEKVLSFGIPFPHGDKTTYVITRTSRPSKGNINFYTGNLADLISNLKKTEGKDIFIDGGAETANSLMKNNLIDEFIISIIPVLLGDGIPLFQNGRPETKLKFLESKAFEKGLVQIHYTTLKNSVVD